MTSAPTQKTNARTQLKRNNGKKQESRYAHPHRLMLGLYAGAFLGMLSETSMNIALPALMGQFHVSTGIAQWMVVGYMLAIGIVLPTVGLLLKWVRARYLVLAALSSFLIGAVLSAIAPNFGVLLAGRILQGVGTGIVLPTMYAAIMAVFPLSMIGSANGVAGLVIMFAPVIGPTLAGIMLHAWGWRSIFWLFVAVAAIAIVLTLAFFRTPIRQTHQPIDGLSILASVIGFGGLVAGVSLVADQGFSPLVICLLVVGIAVLAFYIHRQLHISNPVLDLKALGIATFRVPAVMVTLSFACTLAFMYLVPQELQNGLGMSSQTAGLLMLPGGIVNAVCSFAVGRLYDRMGARRLVWIGGVITLIAGVLFLMMGATAPGWYFILAHVVFMVGIPFIQQSTQSAALAGLPRRLSGDGSTIMNTLQQVFGAISTSMATILLALGSSSMKGSGAMARRDAFVAGSRYGYFWGLALIVIVLVLGIWLHEKQEPRLEEVKITEAEEKAAMARH